MTQARRPFLLLGNDKVCREFFFRDEFVYIWMFHEVIISAFLLSCALFHVNPIIYERTFPVTGVVITGRHAVHRIPESEGVAVQIMTHSLEGDDYPCTNLPRGRKPPKWGMGATVAPP